MLDMSSHWIHLIKPAPGADVNAAPLIFGDAGCLIACQSIFCSIKYKLRMRGAGIIDAGDAAFAGGDPQAARVIQVERAHESGGQAVRYGERREVTLAIAQQAAVIKPD